MPIPYKRKPGLVLTKEPFDHILEKARVENAAGTSQTDVLQRTSEERRRTSEVETILSHETEKVVVVV